jgi:Zn-dependent protease with chaperone function
MTIFVRLWIYVLYHLLWRDSQRAEYLADALAARVSGTGAMLGLLRKLHFNAAFSLSVQRSSLNNTNRNLFDDFRREMASVPRRELQRITRVEKLLASRLDTTHPPTVYRVGLLRAHKAHKPRLVLSSGDLVQLRRELKSLEPRIGRELRENYDPCYY